MFGVEELNSEDEKNLEKKKKVIMTPVNTIYYVVPKKSSQVMDAQKTEKRRGDNELQNLHYPSQNLIF